MFSNKVYDILKQIALIVLPATASLCYTFATIWGLSHAQEIAATITAIDAFLGIILGLSSNQYNASKIEENSKESKDETKS